MILSIIISAIISFFIVQEFFFTGSPFNILIALLMLPLIIVFYLFLTIGITIAIRVLNKLKNIKKKIIKTNEKQSTVFKNPALQTLKDEIEEANK